ncbi:uncharacterized protein N7482_008524 [Penicillium canariense]|uniref:Uncharacterized protein n=1 Tax=Penicillium canariense TaxID=189055 RepID=A0A9W9LIF3_9EURO|nr:uncharacterized protein N7482_008524 [Penicillium canariense]KAJ5157424.1 hypothetical protein N7482_008524 [Penicillium canariense]
MLSLASIVLSVGAALPLATANALSGALHRDVVVIGGGAAGAYAAVRLRDDFNKSIALIEKQDILGGMVDTYVDQKTGATFDFGVQTFLNVSGAKAFFDRFNVSVGSYSSSASLITEYIDFNTGAEVDFEVPSITAQIVAIAQFLTVIEPWESMLQPGYWNFPDPSNIPDDLLIPFGEFLTKYGLEDGAPIIYSTTGLGVGNMSEVATMFALQSFGWDMARALTGQLGLFTPTSGGNQALYNAIATDLGDDVLYSSTVLKSRRTNSGVSLTVRNHKTGQLTPIIARRLLVAIEPTEDNTSPLDLSPSEQNTLAKFTYSNEFAGLVDNAVFNTNYTYFNLPSTAAPNHTLIFQEEPMVASFEYTGLDHLFRVMVIGNTTSTADEAKALAQTNFNTLLKTGHLSSPQDQKLSWAAFSTHGPMHARVSVDEVKSGFYQDLYKLQGARSTWWTGGAFSVNFQTKLWEFNEGLIPKILEGL